MTESYIQNLFADRVGGNKFGKDTVLYKFAKIKKAKKIAIESNLGKELFDFGVGEPDEMAFTPVVKTLQKEAEDPENRGYSDNGIEDFKTAACNYMKNVFNVTINPETEINHSIGSKPSLAMIPSILINPGDYTLITVPGYPVIGTHTKYLQGNVYNLPLLQENNFLPNLENIPDDILTKAKLLYINYPNNPTGAIATIDFYKKVIDFAKKNKIIVVQDAAYAGIVYNSKPLSFLSVPGAKEVGVEIHSLSKAYNMTGWRLAFVCGNELVVNGFKTVKDNYDSGQFKAIQKAGVIALNNPDITEKITKKYKRRISLLVDALKEVGFQVEISGGTFYLYVKIPKKTESGITFNSGEDFSQYLIKEKLISTVPWDDAGNFVRFSVTFETKANNTGNEELIILEEKRIIN